MRSFLRRCYKDQRGAHIVEVALAIMLFALIAAFGYFAFGDALADYYVILACEMGNSSSFIEAPAPGEGACGDVLPPEEPPGPPNP